MGKKKDICSYTYEELAEEMRAAGEKALGQSRSTSGST